MDDRQFIEELHKRAEEYSLKLQREYAVKELEKIKEEIETKCKVGCLPRIIAECNISKSNREWCEYYYCLKIINEHIAKLKEE